MTEEDALKKLEKLTSSFFFTDVPSDKARTIANEIEIEASALIVRRRSLPRVEQIIKNLNRF